MMKKIFLISLILTFTFSYAQENAISKLDSIKVENNTEIASIKDVQTPPILKECDKLTDYTALSDCLFLTISRIIYLNFNASIAKKQKIKTEIIKMVGIFTIDSTGNILNISVDQENEALRNEFIRVIKLIPRMTPAMLNNNPISVEYKIPLSFSNNNNSLF